jgi:hypothetical protein
MTDFHEAYIRWAIVRNCRAQEEIEQYLPKNYEVVHRDPNGQGYLIAGYDVAGWTLDDYVIPRLGSGLIHAQEVWAVLTSETSTGTINMDIPAELMRFPVTMPREAG